MTENPTEARNRHRRQLLLDWAVLLIVPAIALVLFLADVIGPFWQIVGSAAIALALVGGYLFAGDSRL